MLLLATENISNIKTDTGGGTRRTAVLGAAFNNTILCSAAIEDSLLCGTYTALACQTGFYYERQRGRAHLRQQEQLQYYLGFGYFLAPCVCLWEHASQCAWCSLSCVFCHIFFLVHLDDKQETCALPKAMTHRRHLEY